MPPRIKITKDDIINKTLELVRINGKDAINARAIASSLNCSTQPIFSNFATMDELHESLLAAAYNCYIGFIRREVENDKYPKYKAFGMAYVRFAKEERELFKFLFMCDRTNKDISPSPDFEASVEMIMKANGLSKEKATLMHFEMWSVVHGIGTMLATSFLSLEWGLISEMISDVYHGIRLRHASEEK